METLILLGLGWLIIYGLACWWWPLTKCGRCERGKLRSPSGKAFRTCPRCGGDGVQVRWGRRMFGG